MEHLPLEQELRPEKAPRAIWIAAGIFACLSILAAVTSKGFLEADACTHYLLARFGLQRPHLLVSVWNRPLFMLIYTVPATLGGLLGARLTSLTLALVCAWSGWRIAAKLGFRWPEFAFVFVLAQPLLFLHSFSEMTELPFAAAIGLAFLAYLHRRWGWMSLLVAVSPLCRPEGFGMMLLAAMALLGHRQWKWLAVLPSALLSWTMVGWLMWGRPDYGHGVLNFLHWLPSQWPYSAASMYEPGPLLFWKKQATGAWTSSFLIRLPTLVGPLVFPFVLMGTWLTLSGWRKKMMSHEGQAEIAVTLLPWGILAGHSLLWWRGLMASNGELRYLIVTAPMWGVLAGRGFAACDLSIKVGKRVLGPAVIAGILALLPAVGNFRFHVVPLRPYADDRLGEDVARWYRSVPALQEQYPKIIGSHPSLYLYMDICPGDKKRSLVGDKETVKKSPAGTVLVWDEVNGPHNADANMCITREEIESSGWRKVRAFRQDGKTWEVYLSRETITGEAVPEVP
jgi:hypothetical protein